MSVTPDTAAPTGRNKPAQGKERSDATLGHASENTPSPGGATESAASNRGWKRARIGETLRLVNGAAFKPTDWTKDGVPIVRIQNLNNPEAAFNLTKRELPDKFKLHGGELLFAWSGTPGTSFGAHIWRGGEAWLNQHIFNVLFDENEWDKKFLQFAINQNLADYIRAAHGGAGLAHITKGRFEESELLQPEPAEQRRIVAEIEKQFTRLEAGVAALRRVQANLKRYRAAVLKAACEGRLVPTEAALARSPRSTKNGPPAYETGEALLARILTERRQNWQGRGKYKEPAAPDTENLPAIPDGWTWATVEQLASPEANSITDGPFGSNLKTEHYMESGPRVLRLQNIGDGVYVDEEAHISQAHFERLQKHRIFAGDVVIAGFGENPPRSCVIPESLGPAIVKADCIRFKPHSSVLPKYMNAALNSDPVRKRTKGMVHGVGRPRLNLGEIKSIVLPLPPLGEQTRIVAEVERRLSVVEELESVVTANLQRATRLRQSILQRAFTGNLLGARGMSGAG
jgi:type I restriction enzyme S subunit